MIRVEVTQDDINRGQQTVCRACPVALALNRALSEALGYPVETSVQRYSGAVWTPEEKFLGRMRFPRSVEKFVVSFDDEKKVEPFEFNINPTCHVNKGWPDLKETDASNTAFFYYTG